MKPKILAIVGPTAVGKSDLSLQLAQKYHGEIISGDALQIYRQLDIGTAKVDQATQQLVPHHLIDIRNVDQNYSAFQFQQDAQRLIAEITARGHLPIIAGGTGFYLRGLLENLALGGAVAGTGTSQADQIALREKWQVKLDQVGAAALWQELAAIDPAAAAKIPQNNPRRVMRALTVITETGQLFSQQVQAQPQYDAFVLGLNCPRPLLYQRINLRVTQMMNAGLLAEAKWLASQVPASAQAAKGIGYREFYPYFAGERTLAEVAEQIQIDSRHYAKRQLTYFRHQLPTRWYDILTQADTDLPRISSDLADWLKKVN
ncbi:tRNA (adenosine(37)-N6)-dimethylallyltransferase MiaA [Lapidilactobacillus wuchangensis]|uniref:tRNA (adenosine(37)-N6)-dimethylallyltransferase MiaA n=1 Tax=Lapidilactobacillus wuchangensis TaxID=2486001 RepID=UPI000F7A5AE3|nr:tRNA (adenosine(37)-N6)-dimethylallyltransferase MiaA [Lapidilactobacillus wuchangensis]